MDSIDMSDYTNDRCFNETVAGMMQLTFVPIVCMASTFAIYHGTFDRRLNDFPMVQGGVSLVILAVSLRHMYDGFRHLKDSCTRNRPFVERLSAGDLTLNDIEDLLKRTWPRQFNFLSNFTITMDPRISVLFNKIDKEFKIDKELDSNQTISALVESLQEQYDAITKCLDAKEDPKLPGVVRDEITSFCPPASYRK